VVGHAPGFWAEFDGDITAESKFIYPTGPVRREGRLFHLLRTYPNLYADISAISGYLAMSRDNAFGVRFLIEFQDRILFGTDVCFGDTEGRMPHLGYLRSLLDENLITTAVFAKVTGTNALRVLKLYSP
ncbi:MAG: amidohydrolase family protein, partial [Spirochaetia bacterium]